jgi:hypothetical protein
MDIREILNRRSDLSTFLVHLTRDSAEVGAAENLRDIIKTRRIEARSVFGHLRRRLGEIGKDLDSQKCVCFTETPLEHAHMLVAEIDERKFKFEPYGIALTKKIGRQRGIDPVWYVDITPGHEWLTGVLDSLAKRLSRAISPTATWSVCSPLSITWEAVLPYRVVAIERNFGGSGNGDLLEISRCPRL